MSFRAAHGKGINVTLPHKAAACAMASRLGIRARASRVANTLVFNTIITADNTDGIGLVRDLQHCQFGIAGRTILIIGAGGACRGIIQPLLEARCREIVITNRTFARAEQVVAAMSDYGPARALDGDALDGLRFDAIINATSASLQHVVPTMPELNADLEWGYDLAYVKRGKTAFVSHLEARGVPAADGLGMLVEQAAESFYLWRGIRPPMSGVREKLAAFLATSE